MSNRDRISEFNAAYMGTFVQNDEGRAILTNIELEAWVEEEPRLYSMPPNYVIKVRALNCPYPVRYAISVNPRSMPHIVERAVAAIEDGKALPNLTLALDKNNKMYISHDCLIFGNSLHSDLKALGY